MAPRKNAAKKNAAKQRRPKNHGGKAPTAIREETKEESAGATGKADTVVSDEEISDKPAGNNLAASKEDSKQGSTEPLSETSTAPTTTKTSEKGPETLSGETRATTKEPTPEPVGILSEDDVSLPPGILSEDDVPLASLKRKRSIEDKWTANTDAPAPKSPKLVEGQ